MSRVDLGSTTPGEVVPVAKKIDVTGSTLSSSNLEAVTATILASVEESTARSRTILCESLVREYGFRMRSAKQMAFVDYLLDRHGLVVEPRASEADRHDWLSLRLSDD